MKKIMTAIAIMKITKVFVSKIWSYTVGAHTQFIRKQFSKPGHAPTAGIQFNKPQTLEVIVSYTLVYRVRIWFKMFTMTSR